MNQLTIDESAKLRVLESACLQGRVVNAIEDDGWVAGCETESQVDKRADQERMCVCTFVDVLPWFRHYHGYTPLLVLLRLAVILHDIPEGDILWIFGRLGVALAPAYGALDGLFGSIGWWRYVCIPRNVDEDFDSVWNEECSG